MLHLLWLIPVLPLAGFVVNGLLGRRYLSKRAVAGVACGSVLLAFVLSVGVVGQLGRLESVEGGRGLRVEREARRVTVEVGEWIPGGETPGGLSVPWGFTLDPLSGVMLLVVTGVGFLIHVYSVGYMASEGGYYRYFAYLNLFMAMMLTLVLASSFPVMFVGWEGVGLCSYLLIGFEFEKEVAASAGKKAFLVNRVGDLGFFLGMVWIFSAFGTLSISGVMAGASRVPVEVATGIALLLFLGACGKSAQVPLYVWLPDAMAGPTPVSALIHAATMVTAGVYMVCRCSALYVRGPSALMVVGWVGALTALLAATMALRQNDIKRVLAYSTVSQLGTMFVAVGVGAFSAAIFHLMTHAFFKALLFLGAGSVIHALGGEQDLRRMGGLRRHLPVTYATFLLGTLAITGVPGFSGFFSKDEILWKAYGEGNPFGLGGKVLWGVGVVTAGMTAFYMFRLLLRAFYGEARYGEAAAHHLHESPRVMAVPLVVLGVLSVVGGWVGIPKSLSFGADLNAFEHYLAPVFGEAAGANAPGLEWGLMVLALAGVGAGILLATRFYLQKPELPERIVERFPTLSRLLLNKYYVDELYQRIIIGPYMTLCRGMHVFDARGVDGAVNGTRNVTIALSYASRFFDQYVVDGLVNLTAYVARGLSLAFRRMQTGFVQAYLSVFVFGIFLFVSLYLFWQR